MGRLNVLVRLTSWSALLLTSAGVLTGCSVGTAEAEVIEDTFAATGATRLVATIDNGSIEVTSASNDGDTIEITATVRNPERVDYSAVQEGDTVRVVAEVDEGSSLLGGGNSGVDIVVSVPRDIDLELEASNGRINVTGVEGTVSARTSNGRVNLSDVVGDVVVQTSNGGIELADLRGQVRAETSNGSIIFSGTLPSGSENSLKTSNGSVQVSLIDTPGVELDAATSNGRIGSLLPVEVMGETKENELKGTIGDGGSRLEIRTSNGAINIK